MKYILCIIFTLITSAAQAADIYDYAHDDPIAGPSFGFKDRSGKAYSKKDFRGRIIVLNVWATWCAPCVEEMPALSELKDKVEDLPVEIIAVSVDFQGFKAVDGFYEKNNINNLTAYLDDNAKTFKGLRANLLPTTVVFDDMGMEQARVLGIIDWESKETIDYLTSLADNITK